MGTNKVTESYATTIISSIYLISGKNQTIMIVIGLEKYNSSMRTISGSKLAAMALSAAQVQDRIWRSCSRLILSIRNINCVHEMPKWCSRDDWGGRLCKGLWLSRASLQTNSRKATLKQINFGRKTSKYSITTYQFEINCSQDEDLSRRAFAQARCRVRTPKFWRIMHKILLIARCTRSHHQIYQWPRWAKEHWHLVASLSEEGLELVATC